MSLFGRVKHQGRELTSRALERHLRLGVTGLSGSGKTAFITSLVHQLTQGDNSGNLPFFDVVQQQRYLGGQLSGLPQLLAGVSLIYNYVIRLVLVFAPICSHIVS
jgi:predicted YcjX-like family ATPase